MPDLRGPGLGPRARGPGPGARARGLGPGQAFGSRRSLKFGTSIMPIHWTSFEVFLQRFAPQTLDQKTSVVVLWARLVEILPRQWQRRNEDGFHELWLCWTESGKLVWPLL